MWNRKVREKIREEGKTNGTRYQEMRKRETKKRSQPPLSLQRQKFLLFQKEKEKDKTNEMAGVDVDAE